MTKIVNGKEMPLSDADIAQRQADEQAWEANKNERLKEQYAIALQRHIDDNAQQRDYDSGFSCASYVNSTKSAWASEAANFVAWRDDCWQYAIDIQTNVEDDIIEPPSVSDFIANAPILTW